MPVPFAAETHQVLQRGNPFGGDSVPDLEIRDAPEKELQIVPSAVLIDRHDDLRVVPCQDPHEFDLPPEKIQGIDQGSHLKGREIHVSEFRSDRRERYHVIAGSYPQIDQDL